MILQRNERHFRSEVDVQVRVKTAGSQKLQWHSTFKTSDRITRSSFSKHQQKHVLRHRATCGLVNIHDNAFPSCQKWQHFAMSYKAKGNTDRLFHNTLFNIRYLYIFYSVNHNLAVDLHGTVSPGRESCLQKQIMNIISV